MKSVKVNGYAGLDYMKVVTHAVVEPKDDEVLLKVKACGVNNTEIWMSEGAYGQGSKSGWRTPHCLH